MPPDRPFAFPAAADHPNRPRMSAILAEPNPPGQDARMKGDLFSSDHMVQPAVTPGMTIQNAKSIKYAVNGDMLARQGR